MTTEPMSPERLAEIEKRLATGGMACLFAEAKQRQRDGLSYLFTEVEQLLAEHRYSALTVDQLTAMVVAVVRRMLPVELVQAELHRDLARRQRGEAWAAVALLAGRRPDGVHVAELAELLEAAAAKGDLS